MKSEVVKIENVVDSLEAGGLLADKIKENLSLKKYSVGIFFCASSIDGKEAIKKLKKELNIPILGCSSSGEMSREGFSNDSMVLMVMTSEKNIFNVGIIEEITEKNKDQLEKELEKSYIETREKFNGEKPGLMLIFPDFTGLNSVGEIFEILNDKYRELAVFGGGSAVEFGNKSQEFKEYYNGAVYRKAMPYLYIKTEEEPIICYENIIEIDKQIVGKITSYEGNIVNEIDGRPAYEFLKESLEYAVSASSVFILYPAMIFDKGHKYARVIIDINENTGDLILGGTIKGGDISIQVIMSDFIKNSTEKVIKDLIERKKNLSTVLCVSCECRKLINILDKDEEVRIIKDALPEDIKFIGFYSYGEITPFINNDGEKYSFYNNQTISMCAL